MTVPVYEWLLADGTPIGCGTKLEMDYWTAEGVFVGYRLGKVLCQEPASEDERRKAAWGLA
jgi:hypothetical protein